MSQSPSLPAPQGGEALLRRANGVTAIVLGAVGLVAVVVARHAETYLWVGRAYLLRLADGLGLIRTPPPGSFNEINAPLLWSYTDETALQFLLGLGIYLGVAALLLAVRAARQREDSLYLAAGFTCGWLALVAASFWAGMAALGIGAVLVLTARHARAA